MLPSGSTLLKLRAVMILFTSLLILFATPGYCSRRYNCVVLFKFALLCGTHASVFFTFLTWIFIATSLPSFSLPKCTWPIDAAANGFSSKYSSLSLQLGPRSLLTAFCRDRTGMFSSASQEDWCRPLRLAIPTSVWTAWSRRSDGRARRFWPAEG